MHWGGDFGMGFGGGWIFMIIFWGLVIVGVYYLLKSLLGYGGDKEKKSETAREVLSKRFAKGEMSREEYENAMDVLKRNE
jgi:putative membrane protein